MKGKIFNAQEVQAIMAGNKTQFREVIKPYPWHVVVDADFKKGNNIPKHGHDEKEIKCPYQVGQKIKPKPKSGSIDLQLKLFNTELLIKEIKVERLGEISEEDAIAEGCKAEYWLTNTPDCYEYDGITATEDFAALWDDIHKKPEEKWEASPWVFVYNFEVVK